MIGMIFSNWRVWVFLVLIAANVGSYFKGHSAGVDAGHAEVQVQFDAYKQTALEQALAAQVAKDAAEKRMNDANQKVSQDYENLKTATGTAVRALSLDRLRLQSELAASHNPAPGDTPAGPAADATAEDRVLGECLQRYEAVAGDAAAASDQVTALQAYLSKVVP